MSTFWTNIKMAVPALDIDGDEWTNRMMHWHFSEATGSLFWLRARKDLGFNPINDVAGLHDLRLFGTFDADRLRQAPTSDLIPQGFTGKPHRVFETGGTTGAPTRIVDVVRGQYDAGIYEAYLRARGHDPKGNALAMTPSGPHAYGWFVARLFDRWSGSVFFIDFDPRWVKRLADDPVQSSAYIDHLIDQAEQILKRNRVKFLFTTTKLLIKLCMAWRRPLRELGIEVICTGGTSCTAEEEETLRCFFLEGVDWIDTYGNTLIGHALQSDRHDDGADKSYHMPPPLGFLRVTTAEDWRVDAKYGERGRVAITTLLEDLFIPNLLERDSAVRAPPSKDFPWDGVSSVAPLWQTTTERDVVGVEGVY